MHMKILSTVWNIFTKKNGIYEIQRNGGSIMIADICEYVGQLEDSYLFVGSEKMPRMEYSHVHVLDNGEHLPDYRTKDNIKQWQEGLKKRFKEVLLQLKPDFVLVQGGGDFSSNCMEICRELDQKFAFVDHLFQGKQGAISDEQTKAWEDKTFADSELNIIAVSTWMRKRMLETYPNLRPDHIIAIPNGTPYKKRDVIVRDIKKELGLGEKKVLLCSGTLHPRKNQIQLVNVFKALPEEIKKNVVIIFCGNDSKLVPQKVLLEEKIKKYGLEENLRYIGTFSRDDMHDLYAAVDGLIMPSLNEGLSLVAIEALVYGKPVIMFSDNETAGDVNNQAATILVHDHSDYALRDGIIEWYSRNWDEDAIEKYSKSFNIECVANKYVEFCFHNSAQ